MTHSTDIKPVTAIIVLVFFVSLLAGWFWAYGESIAVQGFSYLHKHPSGQTAILFNHSIYRFDDNDRFNSKTDLLELGVPDSQITDFAYFSNGDLLLRQGAREESLEFNIQRFKREANVTDIHSEEPKATLVRCDQFSGECQVFTEPALNLNDAFALEIDWHTNRVFVADSSRHKIYMFSEQGHELDRIDKGLEFPNQIIFSNDTLYIADTNRHKILAYRVEGEQFHKIPEVIDAVPDDAISNAEIWPISFAIVDNILWVINAKNDLSDGAMYLFDISDSYQYIQRVKLDGDTDPVAVIAHGGNILVSDFSFDRIDKLATNGESSGEFLPYELHDKVMEVRASRKPYRYLALLFVGLFILSLAAGIGYALYQQFTVSRNRE